MTIFDDLAAYIGSFVGGTAMGGIVLSMIVMIVAILALTWAVGNKRANNMQLVIIGLIIGTIFDVMVGWLNIWVPVFAVIVMAFLISMKYVF